MVCTHGFYVCKGSTKSSKLITPPCPSWMKDTFEIVVCALSSKKAMHQSLLKYIIIYCRNECYGKQQNDSNISVEFTAVESTHSVFLYTGAEI